MSQPSTKRSQQIRFRLRSIRQLDIMTSSVFFKFKSQKDPTRVEFDGTGISVFELKRDIIVKSGLGDGKDFDLAIYNEDGNEGMLKSFAQKESH